MGQCWWEIQVRCDRALEETVFWRLRRFGCRGTAGEIKGQTCFLRGYLPEQQVTPLDLAALSQFLQQDALCAEFPTPATSWRIMEEQDWAKSWQDHWHPQEIGDRLLIYPAWLKPPSDPERLILRLDPGAAFGTGGHATTQLCLESLEMRLGSMDLEPDTPPLDDFTLADIGCGSGILSIAALLMGIKQAYAVDVDTLAISSTLRNANLNRLQAPRLVTQQGSVEQLIQLMPGPVDGIVCNILAEVIIKLIPQLGKIAKPTTWGILSGILLEQAKAVTDVLEDHGWVVATLWRRQNWCCLNIRRS